MIIIPEIQYFTTSGDSGRIMIHRSTTAMIKAIMRVTSKKQSSVITT